jgi:hypothetical protein
MPSPESLRQRLAHARGWLISAALLALTPKCVLCVLAYAGLGATLGLGGPELCGTAGNAAGPWAAWLPALGAVAGLAGYLARSAKGPR